MAVTINMKHSNMSSRMETFITDAIVMAKLKHCGDLNLMATSIMEKLVDRYEGNWNTIILEAISEFGHSVSGCSGSYIDATHQDCRYVIFKS